MFSLKRWSFAQRMYLMSCVVSLALGALAVMVWVQLSSLSGAAKNIGLSHVAALDHVRTMELNLTRASLQLRHAMLARNEAERSAALVQISEHRAALDAARAAYQGLQGSARELNQQLDAFWSIAEANLSMVQAGDRDAAFAFLVEKTVPARNAVLDVMGHGVQYHRQALSESIERDLVRDADTIMWEIKGVVLLVALLMLSSVWILVRQLRGRVSVSQAVAEKVRDGELDQLVKDEGRDEFSPLLAALLAMQGRLAELVSDIRDNAESVATASAQISQGNSDLSVRTEKQASALQQTAASMEQINGTALSNADSAAQASRLAQQASGVAEQGRKVVDDVVTQMRAIEHASKQVEDIITVINGIAFQTNILALNAAVEAARAGEQGRGFAVVAGEVRTLAQRSAEAARQVRSLISQSVERVATGAGLVDQAGRTMQEVRTSVQRVSDIVSEIAAGSREQMSGVSQVSEAVSHMDQATQQNAALVEQSAAAAESLREQAAGLVRAMSIFRTSPRG
ncbi:methyl-accepting chemotaxis protein [Kinneretia asaccharophila]|jgi:methyl-accepting chemotaxis protein|uniref:Methyl-accepting chemotaxis sensory transducer n=1 Tax=Roseateles asaccharophilus TaxID=582607 RepID=A0A4R6NAS5_9BURK|nr:methyl-accepting chemotaxis protein [Roseateles asaccharophilus]MDN3545024.1 methyl-accepting chemotaxis protein [Roseateles asaccharophilus]TDP12590.1 methyl-accepting chemotaxis sensory transducer [Roseateles asaccharophilus]